MISILRRVPLTLSSPVYKIMESSNMVGGSQRLLNLARQLRLYKPSPPPSDDYDDLEERRIEEAAGKVVSQVGFAESATSVEYEGRFRSKRAAVLICLFEGDAGDLRVILTKRSSKLSTHSGRWLFLGNLIGL